MHERAAVSAELSRLMVESGGQVSRVVATIGPGVDPDVVEGIWDEIVSGTPAASAALVVERTAATLRCLDCSNDYGGDKLAPCPVCGGNGLVIAEPPEFSVRSWVGSA